MSVRLAVGCVAPEEECRILLEPYGAEHIVAVGDDLRLDIDMPDDSVIEVGYSPGCITLWFPASVVGIRAANRVGDTIDLGLDMWFDSSSP